MIQNANTPSHLIITDQLCFYRSKNHDILFTRVVARLILYSCEYRVAIALLTPSGTNNLGLVRKVLAAYFVSTMVLLLI